METASSSKSANGVASGSGRREEKRVTGSGTGSSDNDSLASEVGRLSEENAQLSKKLSEILGKSPATPTSSRSGSGILSGSSTERLRDQVKKLERDNRRLLEQNSSLERRLVNGKVSATADELWRLKEENRSLRADNSQLSSEIEQLNKVASYVGNRVAKVLVGARRANNYNSQLVGELKRWNRRLEDENHRLYAIIDRMQKSGVGGEAAREALSAIHDRGMDGNAKLVKQLEDQNVKLQEEISKLSDHAISLQNLSSSSGSSGSSGILAGPRTPSNHEQDGLRRLAPDAEARRVAERLRDVKAERRKSRNLSAESLASEGGGDDVERLRTENKKYAEEIERIGVDLAFMRGQVTLSQELKDSNAAQSLEIRKLTEAAGRVQTLEDQNATQAVEIERLLDAQTKLEQEAKVACDLREDNSQMEEDIFKLVDEVERLAPFEAEAKTLEARIAEIQAELDGLQKSEEASLEVMRLKDDNVEFQRTLEGLAAEKAVLQAQVRELLEERSVLQNQNKDLDFSVRQLREKANESAALRAELNGMSQVRGQSATYRAQISSLRNENAILTRRASDLSNQIGALQGKQTSGMARGQRGVPTADDTVAQLERLQAENANLAAEIQRLNSACAELTAEARRLDTELAGRPPADDGEREAELEALRAENRELAAQSAQSVLTTVELTTLRNQVTDLRKIEEQVEEQQAAIKQLRADKAALQKEVAALPAHRSDLAALQAQVQQAERAQKAAEMALSGLSSTSLAKHDELYREHQARSSELESLQKHNSGIATELADRESELVSLRQQHEALAETHRALYERSQKDSGRADAASREAAELLSVLQTAKAERSAQEAALADMRAENEELVARIDDLMLRGEEQEKTLASVLARSAGNGHVPAAAAAAAPEQRPPESGIRPRTPSAAVDNPAFVSQETPEHVRTPVARYTDSSEDGWRTPGQGSPLALSQGGSPTSATAPSDPTTQPFSNKALTEPQQQAPAKNGKSGKGFGSFFKMSAKKSATTQATTDEKAVREAPAQAPATLESLKAQAEEQVMSTYEHHVDADDIDGFMAALGYAGFKGPTAPDDMDGAFASAKYACRPDLLGGASDWDLLVAAATRELLEAWHGAWLQSLAD